MARCAIISGKVKAAVLALPMLLAIALGAAGGAETARPLVAYEIVMRNGIPGIPASLSGEDGDAARGAHVAADRKLGNCLSCHEVGALRSEPFHGEIGPPLDGVGARWDTATLRMIVVNPKRVFGGDTVMPAFYRIDGLNRVGAAFAGVPILTAQQVEDVVAFLATMK